MKNQNPTSDLMLEWAQLSMGIYKLNIPCFRALSSLWKCQGFNLHGSWIHEFFSVKRFKAGRLVMLLWWESSTTTFSPKTCRIKWRFAFYDHLTALFTILDMLTVSVKGRGIHVIMTWTIVGGFLWTPLHYITLSLAYWTLEWKHRAMMQKKIPWTARKMKDLV